jgi:hypothetical protein
VGSCLSNQGWRMRYGELLAILLSETIVRAEAGATGNVPSGLLRP